MRGNRPWGVIECLSSFAVPAKWQGYCRGIYGVVADAVRDTAASLGMELEESHGGKDSLRSVRAAQPLWLAAILDRVSSAARQSPRGGYPPTSKGDGGSLERSASPTRRLRQTCTRFFPPGVDPTAARNTAGRDLSRFAVHPRMCGGNSAARPWR